MSDRFILPAPKGSFEGSGNVFIKDVLIAGTYQHPIQPWDEPLVVDQQYIARLCAASNAALAAGQRTYIPDGHSNLAKDNTGFVSEFFPRLVDGTWRAAARCVIEDVAYLPKIGTTIRDVSPLIVNHPLGTGESFGPRIEHVALCSDPVMPGQSNFVACSVSHGSVNTLDVPVLKAQEPATMKIKVTDVNGKALSLVGVSADCGVEVEVSAEVFERALAVAAKATADVGAATTALSVERAMSVEKRLSVDPKTPYFKVALLATAEAAKASLTLAMSKGRLTQPMRAALERMLSVRHAYALSMDTGEAGAVDVVADVNALIASIPDNSVVPLDPATAVPAQNRPLEEAPAFDASAEAKKTLTRLGLGKRAPK